MDLDKHRVKGYSCTCKSSLSQPGMCKHVAATALSFIATPESFSGYGKDGFASSSQSITRLLGKAKEDHDHKDAFQDDADSNGNKLEDYSDDDRVCTHDLGFKGLAGIDVIFIKEAHAWSARFRIRVGTVCYALRDLDEFLTDVEQGRWRSYGSRLSFTHELSAFNEHAKKIISILKYGMDVRKQVAKRYDSPRISIAASLPDVLELVDSEMAKLLDSCPEDAIYVDDCTQPSHHRKKTRIIAGNPPVRIVFEQDGKNGFVLKREGRLSLISAGDELYAFYEGSFYRCDENFIACEGFMRTVYCSSEELQYVSATDVPAFCKHVLPSLNENLELCAPQEMLSYMPMPCKGQFYFDYANATCTCIANVIYEDNVIPLFGSEAFVKKSLRRIVRDDEEEENLREILRESFIIPTGKKAIATKKSPLRTKDPSSIAHVLFSVIPRLQASGAEVFTTNAFTLLVSHKKPQPRMHISYGSHLIDLSVSSKDLSPQELSELLSSYRQRKRYHRLKDGTFLDMKDLDLRQVDDLLETIDVDASSLGEDGHMQLPSYRAFQLDMLADEKVKDATFVDYVSDDIDRNKLEPELPKTLQAVLRPYQKEGFQWLCSLAECGFGGILADEMGLGKSLQLISFLCARLQDAHAKPNLIVCPSSLVYNWIAEFKKFAPGIVVSAVAGAKDERLKTLEACSKNPPDVLITSFDLLKRDIEAYAEIRFSCLALDEAQYIKNMGTKAAQSVKALNAHTRFALTGTPIENRLSELWSIFDFLMPGLLGSYPSFHLRFEQPIAEGDDRAMHNLSHIVGRFILRRLKEDVLNDLPKKSENVVLCRMEGEQDRLYRAHEQRLRESIKGGLSSASANMGHVAVLSELMKLRELACDPRLVYEDFAGNSAKLETIVDLVETAWSSRRKSLVFSQFTSFLDLISEQLEARDLAYMSITGSTPKKRRLELVDTFNSDDTPVFLVSLKAGGTGLNLTGASVVIHADPWWNAAAENQATDRSHRIGQTHDVDVYKVIAANTIEERVVEMQHAKGDLADALLGKASETASGAGLTKEELLGLLG